MKKTSDANLGMHILEIEITSRCNLHCKHCYNRTSKDLNFPFEKLKNLYRFAEKNNIWTFIISGGEALLHPDFDKISEFIGKNPHKFRTILQTNGSLVNENLLEKIKKFDLIHISCDLSDDIRKNSAKNFKLAKKLIKQHIDCYLFVTIHKLNRHLINQMTEKANKLSVPIGFNICIPVEKLEPRFIMTKEEFSQTEKELFKLYQQKKIRRYSSPLISILKNTKQSEKKRYKITGGCTAGIGSCVISPTGEVYPCPFFRLSAGNVFKKPLREIWLQSSIFTKIRNRTDFHEPCKSCDYLMNCGGCRKRAFQKNGDIQDSDPMCYKDKNYISQR